MPDKSPKKSILKDLAPKVPTWMNNPQDSYTQPLVDLKGNYLQNQREYFAAQPKVKQGKKETKQEKALRDLKNDQYQQVHPYSQIDDNGNLSPISPDRGMEGQAISPSAKRVDKGLDHIMTGIEAAGYVTGAGELASLGVKSAKQALIKSTEDGLLSKAYKLNPNRFKSNPEAYYHRSPDLQHVINEENQILQGFGNSQMGKEYSSLAGPGGTGNVVPGTKINLRKVANNELYTSKGSPLDYGRSNEWKQGYEGPYIAEITDHPMVAKANGSLKKVYQEDGSYLKGVAPNKMGDYATPIGDIPLDKVKFYKEDWWKGYKEIPKSTSSQKTLSTSSGMDALPQGYNSHLFNKQGYVPPTEDPSLQSFITNGNITQNGLNPFQLLDKAIPNPLGVVSSTSGIMNVSPLNLLPDEIYGNTLKNVIKGQRSPVGFRKFGNSLEDVIASKSLKPAGTGMGSNQIKQEGNWFAANKVNEKYPGVFEATLNPNIEGSNTSFYKTSSRDGILAKNADGSPLIEIPLDNPGLSFNRRLPFSTKYISIDKQKLIDNKFQLSTFAPHTQSLVEKGTIGMGVAGVHDYFTDSKEDKWLPKVKEGVNTMINKSNQLDNYVYKNLKKENGGAIEKYENGGTMKKLKPKQYLKQRGLKDANNNGDFDNVSPNEAREILHSKKINGKDLTEEQRRLFGFLSKGNTKKYPNGGLVPDPDPRFKTSPQDYTFIDQPNYNAAPYPSDGMLRPEQRMPYNPELIPVNSQSVKAAAGTINLNYKGSVPNKAPKGINNLGEKIAFGLQSVNALIPKDPIRRQYLKPEDLQTYNPNAYGTGSQAIAKNGKTIMADGGIQRMPFNPELIKPMPQQGANVQPIYLPFKPNLDFPERKKRRRDKSDIVDTATYSNGMIYSGTAESDNPTSDEWLINMAKYAQNNIEGVSNVYRPEFSHHSVNINSKDVKSDVAKNGALIKRADGSYSKRGLWDNIRANKGSGKAPTKEMLKQEREIKAEDGVNIEQYQDGGLQTHEGGNAPVMSANHVDGGTGIFQGKSHDEGGIQATYMGKPFEAEGGEPYRIDQDGGLEIFGNLYNPVTGNKFKKDAKVIANKEQKMDKLINSGLELIEETSNTKDKFELMKLNSGKAMMLGGTQKQKELAQSKEHLSSLQKIMLDQEGEKAYVKNGGYFKNGGVMEYADGGLPLKALFSMDPSDPRYKFELTKKKALKELQKQYPGKKISIDYNPLGQDRNSLEQKGIVKGQSKKLSGDFSMHLLSGSKDYNISIDGKPVSKTSTAYKTLHNVGKQEGLYPLSGNTGKEDPYHLSLVQEGLGNTASDFYKKYPKAADWTSSQNYMAELEANKANLSLTEKKAYTAMTSAKVSGSKNYTPQGLPANMSIDGEQGYMNQSVTNSFDKKLLEKITPKQKETQNYTPYENTPITINPIKNQPYVPATKQFPWEQVAPAVPQLFDQADPVKAQQYNPDLFNPYSVSFQDRRNRNTAQLAGVQKQAAYDPSALGVLGSQAYQANNEIDAEEFRTNQSIFNDVQNKNVALLNDAKGKNLNILDNQYVRQTQAIANTRDRRIDAGIQIGDVIAKNNLENKTLDISKNLYKNYSYDENGELKYTSNVTSEDRQNEAFATNPGLLPYSNPGTLVNTSIKKDNTGKETITKNFNNKDKWSFNGRPRFENGGKLTQSKLAKLMHQ